MPNISSSLRRRPVRELVANLPLVPVRQTVLAGRVDSNGQANFLEAGDGLTVNLRASTENPVVMAFAAGFDKNGAVDHVVGIDKDVIGAWSLPPNATSYLYAERSPEGELSFESSMIAPIYSAIMPTPDLTTDLMPKFGASNTKDGFTVSSHSRYHNYGQPYDLFNDAYITGSGQANQDTSGFYYQGVSAYPGTLTIQMPTSRVVTSYRFTTTIDKTQHPASWTFEASKDGVSWTVLDARSDYVFTNQIAFETNYQVWQDAFSFENHTPYLYYRLVFTKVFNGGWYYTLRLAEVELMEDTLQEGTAWFDIPSMRMKVSSLANGWGSKNRLYLGEAITNASGIVSVITYALQGRYDSGRFKVTAGSGVNRNHNLGTTDPVAIVQVAATSGSVLVPTSSLTHLTSTAVGLTVPAGRTEARIIVERGW